MSGTWASGWALNDIVTVGEFAKGVGCVADTTLGGSAASIDLTGIPTTYANLMFIVHGRGDTAATSTGLRVRLNNDSTANYYYDFLFGSAATSNAVESLAQTSGQVGDITAATATGSSFGASICFIPNYGSAALKQIVFINGSLRAGSTTNIVPEMGTVGWTTGGAVNRITLFPSAGNFVSGTRVSVYVMGA